MPSIRPAPKAPPATGTAPRRPPGTALVVALCTAAITVEGYDLIVFGVGLPALLEEPSWNLDSAQGGTLGSLVYVGMLIGALLCGRIADRWGQRRVVLAAVAWFALFTVGCAIAAAPWQFALARLLAGIGMGGVMPSVVALTKEYSPAHRNAMLTTVVLAGIPVGGSIAALVAALWLPELGWRGLFAVGAVLSVLVLALAALRLPESRVHAERGSGPGPGPAAPQAESDPVPLPAPRRKLMTSLFTLANFMILLCWYGLNTWLTQLMREMDYPLGSALQVTLVLNLGAVAGSFVIAGLADRYGPRVTAAGSAVLAAGSVLALSMGSSGTALVLGVTALAGIGAQSALTVLNSWVANSYPLRVRATMLGWVSAIGRAGAIVAPLLGGWILQAALGPQAVFYVFATTAALSGCFFALVPRPAAAAAADAPPTVSVEGVDGPSRR